MADPASSHLTTAAFWKAAQAGRIGDGGDEHHPAQSHVHVRKVVHVDAGEEEREPRIFPDALTRLNAQEETRHQNDHASLFRAYLQERGQAVFEHADCHGF
jgi:hypothetical protein